MHRTLQGEDKMTGSMWKGVAVLLLCAGFSFFLSYRIRQDAHGAIRMVDFGAIYYGARCGMRNIDPYNPSAVFGEFRAEGGRFPTNPLIAKEILIGVTNCIYLPSALFLVIPFAMLPWGVAQTLWVVLMAGLLVLAASLMWDLGANAAPAVWVCLSGIILANCEVLFVAGNAAGIAVSLCVIAVWCFISERYAPAGVLLLAVSLVLKPHDAGFVWLYFLLAGEAVRKRALHTLAVAVVVGLLAAIWIAPSSPHWMQELHRNVAIELVHGGISDPGLSGMTSRQTGSIIDLQAAISIFRDDPSFYNIVSYLVSGSLILIWTFGVLRRHASPGSARLALAAISVLSLLPVYHRPYDAKLLMLTLPACAMLWAERGMRRWIALALTSAGVLATSDIPLALYYASTQKLFISTTTLVGKIMAVLLFTPAPLVLLALGCFYLWVFLRYNPPQANLPLAEKDGAAADAGRAAVQVLPMQAAPPLQPEPLERL